MCLSGSDVHRNVSRPHFTPTLENETKVAAHKLVLHAIRSDDGLRIENINGKRLIAAALHVQMAGWV